MAATNESTEWEITQQRNYLDTVEGVEGVEGEESQSHCEKHLSKSL